MPWSRGEEQVKVHKISQTHPCVVLLDKGRVETTRLTDLLLNSVITEAFNLEVVLNGRIDGDHCISNRHQRHASLRVSARVQVKLVEEKHLIF